MKKLINNIWLGAVMLLTAACGGGKEEAPRTQEQILEEVTLVQAIGKVVPEVDWAVVSSPVSARILELQVREGDTVEAGQVLMRLDRGTADLGVEELQARLMSLAADQQSTEEELEKARIYERELQKIHEISQQLLARQAETREQADRDYSNWKQQEQVVKGLEQRVKSQAATQQEQRIELRRTEGDLDDFQIRAPRAGVITDLTARQGQTISLSDELARIVDPTQTYVEAEVDELFAHDVRAGMSVLLFSAGRQDTLATGQVTYISPVLSDKSILYETANEGEDRRVRRMRIAVDSKDPLIINAKVDVRIKIK